jgi:ABC-type multidrug transport system permease subunit
MNSFDQLYVLSEGHVVYFGKPLASLEYLEQVGLPCPVGYNAADHWMDLLVTDNKVDNDGEKEQEYSTRLTLQNAWRSRVNDNEGDEVGYGSSDMPSTAPDHALDTETIEKYQTSWWEQFLILTHRSLKNSRSALFTWINFIKSIALGMVVGALFFQLEYTEANIYNIRSYSFSSTCYWVIESMFDSLLAFPSERDVVLKERSSGSYRLSAYMMAKTAADAPTRILIPFVYVVVSYWMVGVDKSFVSFIGAVACAVLGVLSGEAFGLFVGAAMYDMEMALAVLTVCALFLMLLGGFYVEEPPAFIAWGKYVSPYKYAFDAQTQMNMRAPLPCDGSDSLPELCPPGSEGTFVSSSDVTDAIGIQGSIAFNIGMLVFWSLFYRYLAYWCLRIKKEGERA